ncbi:GNAT family N-acetyltransferase [Piscibacillus salipiscarius]|uniref:GNAT family N-acetyltransferase n=1 Tax=Piscibacillus salipiscarius TaxID=299480 RepID=UPI0034E1B106
MRRTNRYASKALDALKQFQEDPSRHPIVILYNGQPAGFFILHGWEGVQRYSNNTNALLIRSYSINAKFQGNGIAKQSLFELEDFVKEHFPDKDEIILAVNKKNTVAQQVYLKGGFVDSGQRMMGRKGELYIFRKSLNVS